MSITNGYTDLNTLKAELKILTSDTAEDSRLERLIEEASRAIDDFTGRRFYQAVGTLYYTADDSGELEIDECGDAGTILTDADGDRTYETTWASTDYDLEPFNALAHGRAFTRVRTTPNGNYTFPTTPKGVQVVGSFGYSSSTPKPIEAACLRWAERLYYLATAPLGIARSGGVGDSGFGGTRLIQRDPDLVQLLAPYTNFSVGGV